MFPIMFTLMFTYLFGGALAGSTQAYLQFLLPGILVQANVMITMNTGITLNTDIQKGVFDRFRSLPVWRPSPLVGALLGDVMRYSIRSAIVITLGLVLGFRPEVAPSGWCSRWCCCWCSRSVIVAVDDAQPDPAHAELGGGGQHDGDVPLTFVSNIFVDPKTMPGWLQAVVEVNPITHLATVVRGLMHGSVPAGEIGWVLVSSAARRGLRSHHMVLYRNKK